MPRESADEVGFVSGSMLCAELYDAYGRLSYPADRHVAEFLPGVLFRPRTGQTVFNGHAYEEILPWHVRRTEIRHREAFAAQALCALGEMSGRPSGEGIPKKSRETGADMIAAFLGNRPVRDAVNTLNTGQISGLPPGSCVETIGVVDGYGVRPLQTDPIPEPILEIMRPQAVNTLWIVEAMLQEDGSLLRHALLNDPQCRALRPAEVWRMADELIAANAAFMDLGSLAANGGKP
jgi:alpha-galactosidase/6-phospho-beta-glucosidase family protein